MSLDTATRSTRTERLLIPATFLTVAGNAFQITAAAILVFRANGTSLAVGWLFIAVAIPQVVLMVVFGRVVDRSDRRLLCVSADLISAVTAFALPVWLWIGGPTSLGTYLANLLLAGTAALFTPASNALIKERIPDERLGVFNSRFEMAMNAGMLLASASAGFLVVAFGPTPLFVVNSLTFLASASLTWAIGAKPVDAPVVEVVTPVPAEPGPAVRSHPPIKRIALLYTNGNIGLTVANTILTTLILQTFHKGPWLIGVTDALAGAGFLLGAALYSRTSTRISPLHLAVLGMLGNLVAFSIQPLHWVALVIAIPFGGFCFAQGRIASRTLLMKASPVERVGRIFGGAQAAGLALGVVATVSLAALADATTVPYAFWALAAIQGSIAIGCFLALAGPLAPAGRTPAVLEPSVS